jgi:transposase
LIWADGGYNARQVDAAVAKVPLLRMEIVKRSDDMKGFVVLPRRWVIERTFSWFGRNRRLAKTLINSPLRVIAPPDAPPLSGSQALELGRKQIQQGAINDGASTRCARFWLARRVRAAAHQFISTPTGRGQLGCPATRTDGSRRGGSALDQAQRSGVARPVLAADLLGAFAGPYRRCDSVCTGMSEARNGGRSVFGVAAVFIRRV